MYYNFKNILNIMNLKYMLEDYEQMKKKILIFVQDAHAEFFSVSKIGILGILFVMILVFDDCLNARTIQNYKKTEILKIQVVIN